MVSRPLISISRLFISVRSGLPRMEPMAFWKMDLSCGVSEILRSRARKRDCFAASMSLVASRPVAFRAKSVSVTGLDLEKKFCQGALTLAKPERRAMRETPITPTRERHASLSVGKSGFRDGEVLVVLARSCPPVHQKAMSHRVVLAICSIHAKRNLPLLLPVNSHPAADMTDCICSEGMTTTNKSKRSAMVIWNPNRRTDVLMMLEISQRINSARTAARAMVVEKMNPETLRAVSRDGKTLIMVLLGVGEASPARSGKIFFSTIVDTSMKVAMNGREEKAMAVAAGDLPPGRHSSQSLLLDSIEPCLARRADLRHEVRR